MHDQNLTRFLIVSTIEIFLKCILKHIWIFIHTETDQLYERTNRILEICNFCVSFQIISRITIIKIIGKFDSSINCFEATAIRFEGMWIEKGEDFQEYEKF